MKYTIAISLVVAVMTLAGCAAMTVTPQQVRSHIDPISIDKSTYAYNQDIQECVDLANSRTKHAFAKALLVGLAGAAAGAALGSAMGDIADVDAGQVAAAGAVAGATAGTTSQAYKGMSKAQTIVYNCLINRGYKLLY